MSDKKKLRVLSLGAGVQSSTIALMAEHGEIERFDCAILADTQDETKKVYKWIEWLKNQLSIPIFQVSKGRLSENALRVRTSKASGLNYLKHGIPVFIRYANGSAGLFNRHCTKDFKIDMIQRKLRELGGKKTGVIQTIGISLDEVERMKPSRENWIENQWPLIENRLTRSQCQEWMADKGYPEPPRSSCYMCPYHSNKEWFRLQTEEPEEFEKAIQFEKNYQRAFSQIDQMKGVPYLHDSLIPLKDVNFESLAKAPPQRDLFINECEGMCGN